MEGFSHLMELKTQPNQVETFPPVTGRLKLYVQQRALLIQSNQLRAQEERSFGLVSLDTRDVE